MQAGKLRHRVTIQESIETRDTDGAVLEENWSDWKTVWGSVEPVSGSERYIQSEAQVLAEATNRIRIRCRTGLDHKKRVLWVDGSRTRIFDILHVAEIESRRREIHLICKELPDAD